MTENHCHCEEARRADAAIRISRPPQGKAPLRKGSWHGAAVTEGLPGVDGPFGDNLCSDSHPFLAPAPQTLRCAPLAWVVRNTFHPA